MWIIYKKTNKWFIEWQEVTTSGRTIDSKQQRKTKNDNEWYNGINTNSSSADRNEGTDLDTFSDLTKKKIDIRNSKLATWQFREVLKETDRENI